MLVTGGPANSGTKQPLKPAAREWTCTVCASENPGYWVTCPQCNSRRPT